MSQSDHSEARERAQFEQCQAEFAKIADENDLQGMSRLLGGVYFTHGWCAGRRSLEQERDELRAMLRELLEDTKWPATSDDNPMRHNMLKRMRATVHKGDS